MKICFIIETGEILLQIKNDSVLCCARESFIYVFREIDYDQMSRLFINFSKIYIIKIT